ncbi:unnamed protein product [Brassica rapa subsp. trilocularis]
MFHRFLTLLLLMLLIPLPYSLLLLKPPPLLLLLQLPSLLLKPSPFQPPAILVVATTKFHLPSGSFTQKLNVSQIMEEILSQIIILESFYTSKKEQPIGPYTPLAHNYQQIHTEPELPVSYGKETGYDMVRKTYSYLTREGRSIKPTQNIQDMG